MSQISLLVKQFYQNYITKALCIYFKFTVLNRYLIISLGQLHYLVIFIGKFHMENTVFLHKFVEYAKYFHYIHKETLLKKLS